MVLARGGIFKDMNEARIRRRVYERMLRESKKNERKMLSEARLTVGDVRYAFDLAQKKKNIKAAKEAAKEAGKAAAMGLLGLIPAAATVAKAIESGMSLKGIYDAAKSVNPQEKKSNPFWDAITIDPDTSAIVDDEVEQTFLKALADGVEGLPDTTPLPDADEMLSNWLKNKYQGAHVTK